MSRPEQANGHGPPDFVGVGALGSGHGWWLSLLLTHPEIEPPDAKRRALHFFDRFCADEMTAADVAAYHARFPRRPGTICGEWTGRYMLDGWTAPLLKRAAPDAKLLVMLSDPIERYRAVFMQRKATLEKGERLFMTDVVDRRSFGAQLARLHRFFDPERILVLQFERCRRDPAGQYRRTLEFLGVRDTAFVPRRVRPVGLIDRVLPRRVGERLTRRPSPTRTEPLWPDVEASLHAALDPDVAALKQLVPELDLALWPNFR
jgi:Sulfotransferase family